MFTTIFYLLYHAQLYVEMDTLNPVNIHAICERIGAELLLNLLGIVPLVAINEKNTVEIAVTNNRGINIRKAFTVKPDNLDLQAESIADIIVAETKLALAQQMTNAGEITI